jgi:hypothetical protein
MDMWEAYEEIIRTTIPNFRVLANLESMGDTLNVLQDREDLLNESLSCLCRHSLRDYRRGWVKEKYGIDLFNKRCGSCYKCCVEYIHMTDHKKLPFNQAYYRYCLGQLYKVALAEGIPVRTATDIWDIYLTYPLEESQCVVDIQSASLLKNKIKWATLDKH